MIVFENANKHGFFVFAQTTTLAICPNEIKLDFSIHHCKLVIYSFKLYIHCIAYIYIHCILLHDGYFYISYFKKIDDCSL